MLKFLIKVFIIPYLLNMLMDQIDTLHLVDIGLKFYAVPSLPTLDDLEVKVIDLEIMCLSFWLKFL